MADHLRRLAWEVELVGLSPLVISRKRSLMSSSSSTRRLLVACFWGMVGWRMELSMKTALPEPILMSLPLLRTLERLEMGSSSSSSSMLGSSSRFQSVDPWLTVLFSSPSTKAVFRSSLTQLSSFSIYRQNVLQTAKQRQNITQSLPASCKWRYATIHPTSHLIIEFSYILESKIEKAQSTVTRATTMFREGGDMGALHLKLLNIIMESRHRQFSLLVGGATVRISSNLDSGNVQDAQVVDGKVTLTPARDPMNPQYSLKQSSKTFFHFAVQPSCPLDLSFVIKRMKILEYFASDQQFEEYYRICVGHKQKKGWTQAVHYEKVFPRGMRRVEAEGEYELHFSIKVEQQIYLAYHFPYPFEKTQQLLLEIKEQITANNLETEQKIYFTSELLVESLEGRSVNLLTITNNNLMQEDEESRITKSIFPFYEMEGRPKKFAKPYVFFTCRVHSGETSASFALEGLIDFLKSRDKRAELLRENFVFLIIPVLNPDGVYHGTYRMDTQGHNLNRFYNSAQSHKQPAVFAVQALANYYSSRIVFFMDLHSHPHPNKGSFIYGNCLSEIEDQTETQLYAKILSMESQCFGYNWCNFSTNQMNSRDINELLTKDGSARVQLYKILSIPFAYTMEMGYHGCPPKKRLEDEIVFKDYRRTEKVFTTDDYKHHGRSIVLSLLTLFQINTSNGVKSEAGKYYQSMRQEIFKELIEKEERFRLADSFTYKKIKMIQELTYEQLYQPIFKRFPSLEAALVRKTALLEKRNMIHTISENSSVKKVKSLKKKELSLNIREISKTIEATTTRDKGILSFKSSIEPRERSEQARFQLIDSRQDGYSFAKMLNLDFNPFPTAEKKKIYNVVGNRRGTIKKTIISELEYQSRNATKGEPFDIESIDVNSQIELAEKAYKNTVKYEIISTNRNKVLSNFNHNTYLENEEDGIEYNDVNWEINDRDGEDGRFILPKIGNDKTVSNFNIEVQFQREYDKKYNIREHKDLTPAHYKLPLRNNGLRMRSLIKSNK